MKNVLAAIGFLLIVLSGCTVNEAITALEPTDFITAPDRLEKPKSTPFDLAWVRPDVSSHRYYSVIVAPVRTDYVQAENWIYSASTFLPTRQSYITRVDELASYIQRSLTKEFEAYDVGESDTKPDIQKGKPIELITPEIPPKVDGSGKSFKPIQLINRENLALRVEISISEANFGDPVVYGGLLAVPVPAAANLSTAVKSPLLTLEVKFVELPSEEVIAELVDRRFPQVKIVDVNRLTVSSALRELTDSFVVDLVASYYRKRGETVGKRMPFSLLPW